MPELKRLLTLTVGRLGYVAILQVLKNRGSIFSATLNSCEVNDVLIFPPVPIQVMLALSKMNSEFSKLEFLIAVWVTFYREESRSKSV